MYQWLRNTGIDNNAYWTTSFKGKDLDAYNQKYGTDFGDHNPGSLLSQHIWRFTLKPERDKHFRDMHNAQAKVGLAVIAAGFSPYALSYGSLFRVFGSRFALTNVGIETTTEFVSSGFKMGDMNLISIGSSAFGGRLSAQLIGLSTKYSFNDGFYINSLDQTAINFAVGRANSGLHKRLRKLSNRSLFNNGFGNAFLPSLSIGVQSGLKAVSQE